MVGADHSQKQPLGKLDDKHSWTRNWLWSTQTIARESFHASFMKNIHIPLPKEISYGRC